jgi:hypothetical protein
VTLDSEWSPNGEQLASVEAPDRQTGGWRQNALTSWCGPHVLRLYDARFLPAADDRALALLDAFEPTPSVRDT